MSGKAPTHGDTVSGAELDRQASKYYTGIGAAITGVAVTLERPSMNALLAALSQTTGEYIAAISEDHIRAAMLRECVKRMEQCAHQDSPHQARLTGSGVQ